VEGKKNMGRLFRCVAQLARWLDDTAFILWLLVVVLVGGIGLMAVR
jgi:hypothetical protein